MSACQIWGTACLREGVEFKSHLQEWTHTHLVIADRHAVVHKVPDDSYLLVPGQGDLLFFFLSFLDLPLVLLGLFLQLICVTLGLECCKVRRESCVVCLGCEVCMLVEGMSINFAMP
jgi:hypothetical protein